MFKSQLNRVDRAYDSGAKAARSCEKCVHEAESHARNDGFEQAWGAILWVVAAFFVISPPLLGEESEDIRIDTISPGGEASGDEELRFGDPESTEPPPPTELKKALPPIAPDGIKGKVRALIASVPAGSAYPRQLEEIVALGEGAVAPLVEIFSDPSQHWEKRWVSAMAIGRLGGAVAQKALRAGLSDPLFLVKMASAEGLANMGDSDSAEEIRKSLDDPAMVVRVAAVDALARLRDRDAVSRLVEELRSERSFHRGKSLWIRDHLVDALGQIGDSKAIPALIQTLSEGDVGIQRKACGALAKIVPKAPTRSLDPPVCSAAWLEWNTPPKPTIPSPSESH